MRKIKFATGGQLYHGAFHQFVVLRCESGYDNVMAVVEHTDGRVDIVPATSIIFDDIFEKDKRPVQFPNYTDTPF